MWSTTNRLEPPLYGSPNNGVLLYSVKIKSTEFIYYMKVSEQRSRFTVLRNAVFRSRKFPTTVVFGTENGVQTATFQNQTKVNTGNVIQLCVQHSTEH